MNLLEANCLHEADDKLRRACGSQIESDLTLQVGLKWRWMPRLKATDWMAVLRKGNSMLTTHLLEIAANREAQQGVVLPKPRKFQVARRTCRRCLDCFTEHAVRSRIALWTARTLA